MQMSKLLLAYVLLARAGDKQLFRDVCVTLTCNRIDSSLLTIKSSSNQKTQMCSVMTWKEARRKQRRVTQPVANDKQVRTEGAQQRQGGMGQTWG
ncbi:hypothetical protein OUZ56_021123 [Daphnia magna]|uniref:Secreted protein n=1 Tax=Daphnia magna TaxID=35525 RepID=A0ABQ9ZGG8_9CRUS|nr:hypothetical protein OUZ56_021123 [Daphnia magna]